MVLKILSLLLTLFFCFFLIKKVYTYNKFYRNIIYFILIVWTLLIGLSLLDYINTFSLSLKTTLLLCLGNIALTCGYCLYEYKPISLKKIKCFIFSLKNRIIKIDMEKFFRVVQYIIFIFFIFYFIKYQILLQKFGIEMARMIKFQLGLLFSNKFEYYFFQYLLTPFLYISIFYYCIKFFDNNYKFLDITILIVNIVIYSLIGQGRLIYYQLLIILMIFIYKKFCIDFLPVIKKYYKIFLIFILLICILFFMSFIRMGLTFDTIHRLPEYFDRTLSQAFIYFVGPFKGLDYFVTKMPNVGNYFPGQFTFCAILNPILKILQQFGLNLNFDNPLVYLQQYIPLSDYLSFNALFTYYVNFFMDFSYFGFLIPFFIGYIMRYLLTFIDNNNTMIRIFVYFNLLNFIMGVIRWEYQSIDILITLFFIILLYLFDKGECDG